MKLVELTSASRLFAAVFVMEPAGHLLVANEAEPLVQKLAAVVLRVFLLSVFASELVGCT